MFESYCNLRSVGGKVCKSGNRRSEKGSSVEVGTGVGGCCVGVDVDFGVWLGVGVGDGGTCVLVETPVVDVLGIEGGPVAGNVVWVSDSEEILAILHAQKLNPEIIKKRIM